jgi:hypothetical protein
MPGMHRNDPLVREFGHGTTTERYNMGHIDIGEIKAVKIGVALLHQEWLDEYNFGLYRYSRLLYMKLTSNLYSEELQLRPKSYCSS